MGIKRSLQVPAALLMAGALSTTASATSHTTDPRCGLPADGKTYRVCLKDSGFTDGNNDGIPDGRWIKGVEQNGDGFQPSEYNQWVKNGLSKHRIFPNHSPAVADVGIVRSFPVRKAGEVYQACALARVYDEAGEGDNDMNFVARLTVAQKNGSKQVGDPEEHNAKIQDDEGEFKEFATAPFKMNSSEANNVAVKFRAHSDTEDAAGVAVVKAIKFLRFGNGSDRSEPVDCFPRYATADSLHRNP